MAWLCKDCERFDDSKHAKFDTKNRFAWCDCYKLFVNKENKAPRDFNNFEYCFEPKQNFEPKQKDPWDADLSAKEASKLMRRKVHFGDVTLFDMPDHEPRADKPQALKILEESSEVLEAQKRYEQNPTLGNLADLRDEVADVIQATANFIGGLDAMGVADGVLDFSDDMKLCELRNIRRGRISKEEE